MVLKRPDGSLRPVVADFDWSLVEGRPHPWDGGVRGTPFYMSYEHISGQLLSQKSDMYTCGIILYEVFTGKHIVKHLLPSGDFSLDEINGHILRVFGNHGSIPTPMALDSECGLWSAADSAIHRCLSPDPRARPTASELYQALRSRASALILKGRNGFEMRTARQDVERKQSYLGRERCRMFGNYKEISRLHAWLMPSKGYNKWFAVPPSRPSTNILTIEKAGKEVEFGNEAVCLEDGDVIRIRGVADRSYVVCEWVVEVRPE